MKLPQPRIVTLKSSGELLTTQKGELWTPDGVRNLSDKIIRAHRTRDALNVSGLVIVSGAGNIVRGAELKASGMANRLADVMGRLGTMMNLLPLAEAFERADVPYQLFVAPGVRLADVVLGELPEYSAEAVVDSHDQGKIAMIGFGINLEDITTDTAIAKYAKDLREQSGRPVVILKGTKRDGVFDKDPAKHADATRIPDIDASHMLANYDRYPVVDKESLEMLVEASMDMRVYADYLHDLATVLGPDNGIGSVIRGR